METNFIEDPYIEERDLTYVNVELGYPSYQGRSSVLGSKFPFNTLREMLSNYLFLRTKEGKMIPFVVREVVMSPLDEQRSYFLFFAAEERPNERVKTIVIWND